MLSLAVNGYSAADVTYALRAIRGRRELAFRYELLSATNVKVGDLAVVAGGSVDYDYSAEVKRTAKFTVKDDGSINFASQRIKPWVRLRMSDGGWAEWPMGVFLLTTPRKEIDVGQVVTRSIDAYDQTLVLQDDKVGARYFVSANYKYTDAVTELLNSAGITNVVITASTKLLPVAMDWDPATPKIKIISDLLSAINYEPIWFDGNGVARSTPIVDPQSVTAGYEYATDQYSVLLHKAEQDLDFYKVPNKLILTCSTPDRPLLTSTVTNASVTSPTSTVNRGRTILDVQTVDDVSDQPTLDDICRTRMRELNSVFESIEFETLLMPMHENGDVITFNFADLGINAKYQEMKWSMDFEAGASMKHTARKTVVLT